MSVVRMDYFLLLLNVLSLFSGVVSHPALSVLTTYLFGRVWEIHRKRVSVTKYKCFKQSFSRIEKFWEGSQDVDFLCCLCVIPMRNVWCPARTKMTFTFLLDSGSQSLNWIDIFLFSFNLAIILICREVPRGEGYF